MDSYNNVIIITLLFIAILGRPSEIKVSSNFPFIEFSWKTEETTPTIVTPSEPRLEPKILEIKIESFTTRQEIYEKGDTAFVDFEIKNTLGLPYNISVDWFYNNTRYKGWFNQSTEIYNTTQERNFYWSSYGPLNLKGDWEVQLIVKYEYFNKTYSKDAVTKFRVV